MSMPAPLSYVSTRGGAAPADFKTVLLSGMAPDGGLYLPAGWPALALPEAPEPYAALACRIVAAFTGNGFARETLAVLCAETYGPENFDHPAVAPLVQIGSNHWILELFHGPTLSFKDYALQLLGRLFDHVLEAEGARMTIVGATSGDTGSAAIEACRNCRNIDIFILHPEGRTSAVQRRQMTTVLADNVHNIALDGTFDDCQAFVKALFADRDAAERLRLSAVNSINWARIAAQIVYYAAACTALGARDGRPVSFAVPTGNFGNIFAAYAARSSGLPIGGLVAGTNMNDILTRFFESGSMAAEKVVPSLSPSMDIQVSSNFERYLAELCGRDAARVRALMQEFSASRRFDVSADDLARARRDFRSFRVNDDETLATMRALYAETGYIADPHTAVGVSAARAAAADKSGPLALPLVSLACAHPAKFPDAVMKAIGRVPEVPARLAAALEGEERYSRLPNDYGRVRDFILANARA